ncbi:predicted protein, partial [Nematostella vectensis]
MEPTRGENTLDLVLTTCPEMVLDLVVEPGMSDHDLVLFDLNLKPSFNKKKPLKVFVFKKGNMGAVKTDLKKHLDNYFNNEAYHKLINENYDFFKTTITEIMKKHIPQKNISGRWNLPWITSSIKRLIRKKQRLYNHAKHCNNHAAWKKFKDLRKLVKKKLAKAHSEYVSQLLTNTLKTSSSSSLSTYIKSKKTHDVGVAPLRDDKGELVSDSLGKAHALSSQFQSVFT